MHKVCGAGVILASLLLVFSAAGDPADEPPVAKPAKATESPIGGPTGVAVDSLGNLYIASADQHVVLKLDAAGKLSVAAGDGRSGFAGDDGPAAEAQLNQPAQVAVDLSGNLYIADRGNHRIRRVDAASGIITTVAGTGEPGFAGDDNLAAYALLSSPAGVAVDAGGNVWIADTGNHRIRFVSAVTGRIKTVAGDGTAGFGGDGGPAREAQLASPAGLAVDRLGDLFIADRENHRIRRLDASSERITTVAGSNGYGFAGDGEPATQARLHRPVAVAVDPDGHLYIADQRNGRIRRVGAFTGFIDTVAGNEWSGFSGDDGPATSASLAQPAGVAADREGQLFIADQLTYRIRRVELFSGLLTTVAGNGHARVELPPRAGDAPADP